MTRIEMLTELREVLNDATVRGMWVESTLLGYLAEGQDEFCEQTGYFVDTTTHTITLQTNVAVYDIPDRIIQILAIWDGTRKLTKKLTGEVIEGAVLAGDPVYWQTDQETGVIKFSPTPTADENGDELVLQTWRYSKDALDDDGKAPEIPSRFHRACIEWAAYKAFMHHDMETQDPVKAAEHLLAFNAYVRKGHAAFRRYHNQETRVGTNPAYRT